VGLGQVVCGDGIHRARPLCQATACASGCATGGATGGAM